MKTTLSLNFCAGGYFCPLAVQPNEMMCITSLNQATNLLVNLVLHCHSWKGFHHSGGFGLGKFFLTSNHLSLQRYGVSSQDYLLQSQNKRKKGNNTHLYLFLHFGEHVISYFSWVVKNLELFTLGSSGFVWHLSV